MAPSKPNVPAKTVADEAAARAFDADRWESFVRLRCLEIAVNRGVRADDAWAPTYAINAAKALADFVLKKVG